VSWKPWRMKRGIGGLDWDSMRWMVIWLRNVGNGVTPVCGLAAFDCWDCLVSVGFDSEAGGRGRNSGLNVQTENGTEL